jgi:hypothetical protein
MQLLLAREVRPDPVRHQAETLRLTPPLSLPRAERLAAALMVAALLAVPGLVARQQLAPAIRNVPEEMERLVRLQHQLPVAEAVPVPARPPPETMHLDQRREQRLRQELPAAQEGRVVPAMARMLLRPAVAEVARYPPLRPAARVVQVAPVGSG